MEQRSFNEGELQIKEIMHSEQKRSKSFCFKANRNPHEIEQAFHERNRHQNNKHNNF